MTRAAALAAGVALTRASQTVPLSQRGDERYPNVTAIDLRVSRKFKFGTPEYDRWAVVYGRVVAHKGDKKAAADLVFRGDGVILFLTTDR